MRVKISHAIFIFNLRRCHEDTVLHLHSSSRTIVRSVQFAVLTQFSQNLCRFHGVPPHVVTMATETEAVTVTWTTYGLCMVNNNQLRRGSLHGVVRSDPTGCSVFAVETVLKVQFGFSNQIIGSHQVPVIDRDGECGVHRECGLHVKGSNMMRHTQQEKSIMH